MESYRVVDQPTRRRMEELLATWREAGPGGRPMLGDASQQAIERSLYGSQGAPVKAANAPNKSQVIADIERRMALCTKDLANEPHNTRAREQNDVLRQLKEQVNGSDVSAELLGHIQKQLDEMSSASVPAPAPTSAPAAPSASELIANLMKAGLLPSSATTTAAPTSVPSTQSQDKAYTDYIMSLDLRMVTVNLSRPAPELEILMQEHLPHPCRQCANRYPEGEAGQHSLDDHLDWHFTQNRRARASIVRGQSRAWFDPASRWIRSGIDDVMPGASGSPGWEGEDAESEQALRDKIAMRMCPCLMALNLHHILAVSAKSRSKVSGAKIWRNGYGETLSSSKAIITMLVASIQPKVCQKSSMLHVPRRMSNKERKTMKMCSENVKPRPLPPCLRTRNLWLCSRKNRPPNLVRYT